MTVSDKPQDMPEISPGLAMLLIGLNEAGGKDLIHAVANLVKQVGPEQAQEHLKRYSAVIEFEQAAGRDPSIVLQEAINSPNQRRFDL